MGQAGRHCTLRFMDFTAQWGRLNNEKLYELYSSPNTSELHLSGLKRQGAPSENTKNTDNWTFLFK
jgi:hypothetical protein